MRFIALALLLTLIPHLAFALDVTGLRFGTHPEKQRIVIELSGPAKFKAYTMQDPDRLIIDLPGFGWKVGTIQKPVSSLISDIRHGDIGGNQSRLVLQTSSPTFILSSFLIPADSKQPNRIVIDFQSSRPPSASTVQNLAAMVPAHATAKTKTPQPQHRKLSDDTGSIETAQQNFDEKPKFGNKQKPLIIIDPGHGGQDPGARAANGNYEKTIVLAVGLELKKQLEDSGQYRVQMTRDTDIFIPLQDRVKFARRNGGDLFVSLHADSMSNSSVSGASVYTLSDTASDKEAEKLAERENKSDAIAGVNLSNQDNDVANILIDLASRDTMNQSRYLANTVVSTMPDKGVHMLERKPHRSAGFAVLKALDIPSILVEMGYLTNYDEAQRLSSQDYRAKVAQGLKASVDSYFTKVAKLSTP